MAGGTYANQAKLWNQTDTEATYGLSLSYPMVIWSSPRSWSIINVNHWRHSAYVCQNTPRTSASGGNKPQWCPLDCQRGGTKMKCIIYRGQIYQDLARLMPATANKLPNGLGGKSCSFLAKCKAKSLQNGSPMDLASISDPMQWMLHWLSSERAVSLSTG